MSLGDVTHAIDAVVTSPQLRAAETAELLVQNAAPAAAVTSIVHDPDLCERSAGEWSGLTTAEIDARYPGFLASGRRPDGFETDDSLFERVDRALRSIERRFTNQTVLAVCHGGVINTLVAMSGTSTGRLPNLSGHRVTMTGGNMNVGERFDLLDEAFRTGGDSSRV